MAGTIPNYVCTVCGRGFPSSRSARRHVKNVESGLGYVLSEADYRTSILTGRIRPPLPTPIRPTMKKKLDLPNTAVEEFLRGFYKRLGEKKADKLTPEDERTIVAQIMLQMTNLGFHDLWMANME